MLPETSPNTVSHSSDQESMSLFTTLMPGSESDSDTRETPDVTAELET